VTLIDYYTKNAEEFLKDEEIEVEKFQEIRVLNQAVGPILSKKVVL
jgi:hypothetical protein